MMLGMRGGHEGCVCRDSTDNADDESSGGAAGAAAFLIIRFFCGFSPGSGRKVMLV